MSLKQNSLFSLVWGMILCIITLLMHMYTVWGSGMWNVIASWNIDDYLDSEWLWTPSLGCHNIFRSLILSFSLSFSGFLSHSLVFSLPLPLCLSVYSHHWVQVVTVLLLSLYSSVCSYFTLPCVSTSTRHTFFTNWWRCELHTVSSVCACVCACVTGGLLKTLVWPCLRPEGLHWFLETTRRANVC